MGAIGAAILAMNSPERDEFDFSVENTNFTTREITCGKCPNNCEIVCVYKENEIIDAWGNRCERGQLI